MNEQVSTDSHCVLQSDAQPFHFNHFGGATVPIAIDSIFCQGNELTWSECPYSTTFTFFCTHVEDAGLRCFNGQLWACLSILYHS